MDMSKLPRLSQSPQPPPPPASPEENLQPEQRPAMPSGRGADYSTASNPATGAEIWISAAIGIILMLMAHTFGTYVISLITHEAFHTNVTWTSGPNAGQEVGYWDLSGFTALTDASLWLFGLALISDAVVLFFAGGKRAWLVGVGFALTLSVCAFNAYVCAKLFNAGLLPIISLLGLAFGVYMAIYQWRLFNDVRAAQAFPSRSAGAT